MDQKSGPRLFSARNIIGAALVAGIAVGVYLGNNWKGLGGGSTLGVGLGDSKSTSNTKSADSSKTSKGNPQTVQAVPVSGEVIKVVIDNRSYFLRTPEGDHAIQLDEVVKLAKSAKGDEDGIRVRIYRKPTSRPSAEEALRDGLMAAGITDEQISEPATPVEP